MVQWNYIGNGLWELKADEKNILKAYAYGESVDGRRVDTRTAELTMIAWNLEKQEMILRFSGNEGLDLVEHLSISPSGVALAACRLQSTDTQEAVMERLLTPLVSSGPDRKARGVDLAVWVDMGKKILIVPYDNTPRWKKAVRIARLAAEREQVLEQL